MEAQPIQDVVAAAVRDSDIYVAYEELDAARDALKKAFKAYPAMYCLKRVSRTWRAPRARLRRTTTAYNLSIMTIVLASNWSS